MTTEWNVDVAITGERSAQGPATWGQRAIWNHLRWIGDDDHYFNIAGAFEIPCLVDLDRVRAAVGELVRENESLRTNFTLEADGCLRQRVAAAGTLPILVIDGDGADLVALAEQTCRRLASESFDLENDWPLRIAVLLHEKRPRAVVYAVSHAAADGGGARVLDQRLADLLSQEEPPAGPGTQPLELAEFENGERGAALSRASVAYWRRTLETAPSRMFTGSPHPPESPRYWKIQLESRALRAAVHTLADRHRVSTSLVYLTAVAAVLLEYTKAPTALLKLVVSNRLPELRGIIAPLAQDGLFRCERPEGTFSEFLLGNWGAWARAHRYSRYVPEDLDVMLEEIDAARGEKVDLTFCLNDKRVSPGVDHDITGATREELDGLLPESEVTVIGSWDAQDPKVFACVDENPPGDRIDFLVDTCWVPLDDVESLLRAVESLLVSSVSDDTKIPDSQWLPRRGE